MNVLPATTDLLTLRTTELARLFRTSPAGPIPDGDSEGIALLFSGTPPGRVISRAVRLLAWQGKIFDRDHRRLENKVTPLGLRRIPAEVRYGPSLFDGNECLVLDYSPNRGPASRIRDEIRLLGPDLYLGMAYFDGRRVATFALRFGTGRARRAGRRTGRR